MAENVSNVLQPFWAVPVVAIAGITDPARDGVHRRHFCCVAGDLRGRALADSVIRA